MKESSVADYITKTFPGVETTTNFGYTFFFYKSDHLLPFATIASSDNEYESISKLDRPGVFRLNVGVSRQTFQSLFGADATPDDAYDFTAPDTLLPHPVYGRMHWVCVLNPAAQT